MVWKLTATTPSSLRRLLTPTRGRFGLRSVLLAQRRGVLLRWRLGRYDVVCFRRLFFLSAVALVGIQVTQIYVCPDVNYDAATGMCSAGVWVEQQQTFLPPLSAADGQNIGFGLAVALVSGYLWRLIGKALDAY